VVPGTFSSSDGNSNPLLPAPITGVKFDAPNPNDLPYIFSFDSDRAPVYGDFYAKAGNPPPNGYAVFNSGEGNHASTLLSDFRAAGHHDRSGPRAGFPRPARRGALRARRHSAPRTPGLIATPYGGGGTAVSPPRLTGMPLPS